MHAILEKTHTLFIWTTFNRKKMVLAEINKEWPSDKSVPSFRPHNREEVLKLDEFVRRLTEGEGSSKFVFQKCGLGPNAIREMVMSHMRERRRKEKDSCVTDCKLPSAGDSGGDTESVDSSSNDSSSSNKSAVEKKRQEYTDYFHPCKYKQIQITTFVLLLQQFHFTYCCVQPK